MRVVFAGTPAFACPTLKALIADERFDIQAVYTQPDRPAGRGRLLTPSPVKQLAEQHGIRVYQPLSLKSAEAQAELSALKPDVIIVVAYGLILPKAVLDMPHYGCINVHASLLPRWRGAAPIQHAILAGDTQTGVTIMQMDVGLDTGPMLKKVALTIDPQANSADCHEQLSYLGADALIQTLAELPQLEAVTQDETQATHAPKIAKVDANINWHQPARTIHQQIRAYYPWPVAQSVLNQKVLRIHRADFNAHQDYPQTPGTIVHIHTDSIEVAAGKGSLRIQTAQLPGGKALAIRDLLNARQDTFATGMCFESPA